MALRQHRPDPHQYEEFIPKENQARYQEYHVEQYHINRLKDVLFFVNVVLFSILTVVSTYIFLSIKVPTFIAFVLGIASGFVGLRLVQISCRAHYQKRKAKKLQR